MIKRRWLSILLLMAACSTTADNSAETSQNAALTSTEAPDPSPLDGYGIPSGRCGMILWTTTGGRVVPIFRSVDTTSASMRLDGEKVPLTLVSQDGPVQLGMRSQQKFIAQEYEKLGIEVDADVTWGQTFPSGIYVNSGTVVVRGADGWSRILPVAGIAGCKA